MAGLLSEATRDRLIRSLIQGEGLRLRVYRCPAGALTIGVGHNLSANPISKRAAMLILEDDIDQAVLDLHAALPWVGKLDEVRYRVLIEMAFNLGIEKLRLFKATLRAVEEGRYEDAAVHMLNSEWANQVGARATRLAEKMRTGCD